MKAALEFSANVMIHQAAQSETSLELTATQMVIKNKLQFLD